MTRPDLAGPWEGPLDRTTWQALDLCSRDARARASFGRFIDAKLEEWLFHAMRIGGEASVPTWHRIGEAQTTRRWLEAVVRS